MEHVTSKIQRCFNRSSANHHQHAHVQRQIGSDLLTLLKQYWQTNSGDRILEIGCGQAPLLDTLTHPQSQYIGLDIAEKLLAGAQSIAQAEDSEQESSYNQCHWIQADMTSLPFSDQSFDVVMSSMALHWTPNARGTLEQIWRVLKPGGYLAIALPVQPSLQEFKNTLWSLGKIKAINSFGSVQQWQETIVNTIYCEQKTYQQSFTNGELALAHIRGIGANHLWSGEQAKPNQARLGLRLKTVANWRQLRRHPHWKDPISLEYHIGFWLARK